METPYVTLLDLDVARYQGGWGRISNIKNQLEKFSADRKLPDVKLAKWNDDHPVRTHHWIENGTVSLFKELENRNVFFSEPMDLDFSMLIAYPEAYDVSLSDPDDSTCKAVLGK